MVRRSDDGLIIIVADQGIGMTEDEMPIALEPFRQIEGSLALVNERTGLGLPISKHLIQMEEEHLTWQVSEAMELP